MRFNLPDNVTHIINLLYKHTFEAYVVGGCVRDMILNLEPNDYDICTSATPDEVKEIFAGYRIIETGLKHGTITVIISGKQYEITTFRCDGEYIDNRKPKNVVFIKSLKEDLNRRDFTINAMAYNHIVGFIDYFNGLSDLNNKIICTVGDASERFSEDALRIMRALRFSSTLGYKIEKNTHNAIISNKNLLKNISLERINVEFSKLLLGNNVFNVLMKYFEVIEIFIPEISNSKGFMQNNEHHIYDIYEHSIKAVEHAKSDLVIKMTMFLHDIGKIDTYTQDESGVGHFYKHAVVSAEKSEIILKRMKYDNKFIESVKKLVFYHDAVLVPNNNSVKRWLNKLGTELFKLLIGVKIADAKAQNLKFYEENSEEIKKVENLLEQILLDNDCFKLEDLNINGNDLINLGICQGEEIGKILNKLLEDVIDEKVKNEFKQLKTRILLMRS